MNLTLIFLLLQLAFSTDIGVISYFQTACPQGWEPFIAANKRFILSEGGIYRIGDVGGVETVTLSIEQMPSHSHTIPTYGRAGAGQTGKVGDSGGGRTATGFTSFIGGNQPHENMPPYIVLKACKKTNATKVDCSSVSSNCDTRRFQAIESGLTQRFLSIESGLTQETLKTLSLEIKIADQLIEINKLKNGQAIYTDIIISLNASLSATIVRLNTSLFETTIRTESIENQLNALQARGNTEIGLAIASLVLSFLALLLQFAYACKHRQ